MAPFASMLKARKGRKQRPITPPSPGSFYAPQSPTWYPQMTFATTSSAERAQDQAGPSSRRSSKTNQQNQYASPSRLPKSRKRDNNANDPPPVANARYFGSPDARSGLNSSSTSLPIPQSRDSQALPEDDAVEQITSYSFPAPPNAAAGESSASGSRSNSRNGPSVRFADTQRPAPSLKVNLEEKELFQDMLLATGLIAAPGKQRRSEDHTSSSESSSSGGVSPPSSLRRVPPKPIRIPGGIPRSLAPTIEVEDDTGTTNATAGGSSDAVLPSSSKPPIKSSPSNATRLSPNNPSSARTSPSSSNPSPSNATSSAAVSTGGSASGPGSMTTATSGRGRFGSSPDTSVHLPTAAEGADEYKEPPPLPDADAGTGGVTPASQGRSRNSKPQPPLPLSPPYQSPVFEEPKCLVDSPSSQDEQPAPVEAQSQPTSQAPSRPPRPTNPGIPANIIIPANPAIANLVSTALHRQSGMSTMTTFTTATVLGGPPVSSSSASQAGPPVIPDLPFSPGFLLPPERLSGYPSDGSEGSLRVDSATLPVEFEGMQKNVTREIGAGSARSGPLSLLPPSSASTYSAASGSLSSSPIPRPRMNMSATDSRFRFSSYSQSSQRTPLMSGPDAARIKLARRSVSASDVRALVMQVNMVDEALDATIHESSAEESADARSSTHTLQGVPIEGANELNDDAVETDDESHGEIVMMLDIREPKDIKGKGKEIPTTLRVSKSQSSLSGIPEPRSRSSSLRDVSSRGHSPPYITIPSHAPFSSSSSNQSASPMTPQTASSTSTTRSGKDEQARFVADGPSSQADRGVAARMTSGSRYSTPLERSEPEKDIAKLTRGMQQLAALTIVKEVDLPETMVTPATARERSDSTSTNMSSNFGRQRSPSTSTNSGRRPSGSLSRRPSRVALSNMSPPSLIKGETAGKSGITIAGGGESVALRRKSFSKPPRPAPRPTSSNPSGPPSPTSDAPSGASGRTFSVAPLKISKAIPNVVSATLGSSSLPLARQKARDRSASDAMPLAAKLHPTTRSSSISSLQSPSSPSGPALGPSSSATPAGSQAPSSFSAAISRAFSTGLIRKRSGGSTKGKERAKDTDTEADSREASCAEDGEKRKAVPAPLVNVSLSGQDSRRNTSSQFPQTPRPFSVTSSAEHHPNGSPPPVVVVAPPVAPTEPLAPRPLLMPQAPVPLTLPSISPVPVSVPLPPQPTSRPTARSSPAHPVSGTSRKSRLTSGLNVAGPSSSPSSPGKSRPAPPPKFESVPIPWKGLTLDAAKWTFSSKQLQDIVSCAIRHSAEASSIRLLAPEVLRNQLPNETYRLELLREDIKARYKFQVRRRKLLMRSLNLYVDGSDPDTAQRLADELMECAETCDYLSQELFQVTDQLAQMTQVTQRHTSSALSMALRKLNMSFIKAKGETIDLQLQLAMLEAERDEAWTVAENMERELDHYKRKYGVIPEDEFLRTASDHPPSSWGSRSSRSSRVSAARKTSVRASKASLRMSTSKRSARSSTSSVKFAGIVPPNSSSSGSASGSNSVLLHLPAPKEPIPPVPTIPRPRPRANSDAPRPASMAATPSTASRAMIQAQNQLFEMLGIPHEDIGRGSPTSEPRQRSYSDPSSPEAIGGVKPRRASLPSTMSILESPSVIAAMLSLPSTID
ncbi:hypothetical protein FRB99_006158 [Tulasnella sp. 403]|nr:hypothetical protein FRB99_006158 [Tulasnella sp. 403]